MVATFSPHRDAGGTLHLPSPTGMHHVDASSAIRQLRRSLSRSPSKNSDFRLLPSRTKSPSNTPFVSSPLSPSRRIHHGNLFFVPQSSNASPLAVPYPPSAKITRPVMRRTGTLQPTRTRTSPRSPVKRALTDSTDQGNATPVQPLILPPGDENMAETPNVPDDDSESSEGSCTGDATGATEPSTVLKSSSFRIEKRRSGTFGGFPPSVSPLKRSDGIMGLDQASRGSPSAKRRSVHSASFGNEFNIFANDDSGLNTAGDASESSADENTNPTPFTQNTPFSPLATIPKRSSSLRRSTLQQRQSDRFFLTRSRGSSDAPETPTGSPSIRPRMSLDSNLFLPPPAPKESLFGSSGTFSNPPGRSLFSSNGGNNARHPLSRTITQSSSSSSLADESPTHEPVHKVDRPKPIFNFSKSLPVEATRPGAGRQLTREDSTSSSDSFATPENYKLVKPLPAAFMSTGLISKKNRNAEDPHSSLGFSKNMPDTPCKRPVNLFSTQKALPERPIEKPKLLRQSFAAAASPFNPPESRPSPGPFSRGVGIFGSTFNKPETSRRGSWVSLDGDDRLSQSPSARHDNAMNDFDLPPTPTKQSFFPSRTYPPPSTQLTPLERLSEPKGPSTSPLNDKFLRASPRTPQDQYFPPDPSGLSISAVNDPPLAQPDFSQTVLPATPTGPRDSFPQPGHRPSLPLNVYNAPDVDPSLTARFERVELVGTGEFSQVYRVSQPHASSYSSIFSLPSSGTTTPTALPDRIWAVKKAKHPYTGPKDRQRRIREVDVLKALANSDHIISFVDSWEDKGHLYIQTEYCEEGSLDVFLAQVGLKARLDDFRIWKILLELSLGLKHIHDSGFIHLDLKPANILITFEGVLKIADFGMAARWPAEAGIEGEGDREYIGPEILMGRYDKPADIFALGLIMFEIAGNVELPDNGLSWQKLRNGDMSDVPSLTWSSETSIFRDASGNPLSEEPSFEKLCASEFGDDDFGADSFLHTHRSREQKAVRLARSGELVEPPEFMVDANHEQALDKIVRWMISPNPDDRPTADQILQTYGVQFAERRRRAGATVFEGNWGPADEVLAEDAEMIDV
ncbi:hypothetical protein DTO166G4_8859 [Paecilomyces variotii]|nr:hypothetical protein DTO166G4_8859 [Paecilomyces variotii]KAJ9234346.1 hypothetical protein DTO166G5_5152 [Paecilomyces variotii]